MFAGTSGSLRVFLTSKQWVNYHSMLRSATRLLPTENSVKGGVNSVDPMVEILVDSYEAPKAEDVVLVDKMMMWTEAVSY
jgi:hypothetical protein